MHVDVWPWGREQIIWGDEASHRYTLKILEPKKGRAGCLSLQKHDEKSETWVCYRGVAWTLVVVDGVVCTRIMRPGDIQTLDCGVIHRLMGVSDDVQVIEPSTPDAHAADKTAHKDVIRLHCMMGRECAEPRDEKEAEIVKRCIELSEEACECIERGETPQEHNAELLSGRGALRID